MRAIWLSGAATMALALPSQADELSIICRCVVGGVNSETATWIKESVIPGFAAAMAAEGRDNTVTLIEFGGQDEQMTQQLALDVSTGAGADVAAFDGLLIPSFVEGVLLPTAMFIMRDFIDSIPRSYEESAMVVGASPLQAFRDVALPMIRPGILVVVVWAFVNIRGSFLIPFILLRSPEVTPAPVAIYSFYSEAGTPIIMLPAAYSLICSLPVVALYLFVSRKFGFRFFGGIKA